MTETPKFRERRIRAFLELAFFLCVFCASTWAALDDYFCTESGRAAALHQAFNLAIIVTLWDVVAHVGGLLIARFLQGVASAKATTLWVGGGIGALSYCAATTPWRRAHRSSTRPASSPRATA